MVALPDCMLMNVEDYLQLDRSSETRYEYIDGALRMLAGGTLRHSLIGVNVVSVLRALLRHGPCRVYNSDSRVYLSETRYVYPDATISCAEHDDLVDIIQHPRVVLEVLSPGTGDYDRGQKFIYYRQCPTIQEYVLIDSQHPTVEVFRREQQALWLIRILGPGEDVTLKSLDLSFPVDSLYEGITFQSDDHQPA